MDSPVPRGVCGTATPTPRSSPGNEAWRRQSSHWSCQHGIAASPSGSLRPPLPNLLGMYLAKPGDAQRDVSPCSRANSRGRREGDYLRGDGDSIMGEVQDRIREMEARMVLDVESDTHEGAVMAHVRTNRTNPSGVTGIAASGWTEDSQGEEKKPRPKRCRIPFRPAIIMTVAFGALLTCVLMFLPLYEFTTQLQTKTAESFGKSVNRQFGLIEELTSRAATASHRSILGRIRNLLWETVMEPPDRAIDALWGTMQMSHSFDPAWTGQTEKQRAAMAYRAFLELQQQQKEANHTHRQTGAADFLYVAFQGGDFSGTSFRLRNEDTQKGYKAKWFDCPLHSSTAEDTFLELGVVKKDPECNEKFPLKRPWYTLQSNMAEIGGPLKRLWSGLYVYLDGTTIGLTKTAPVAYCGDYSCFEGVIAADITLKVVGQSCDEAFVTLQQELMASAYQFPINRRRFQNGNSDEGICIACPLGQFRSASSAACEACAVDHFADEPGLSACKPCPEQSEQAQMGQSACACQVGSFKDPADPSEMGVTVPCLSCESVLPGSSTLHPNSESSNDCLCPSGTYWHRPFQGSSVAFCKPCSKGLICLGGTQAPLQALGYSAGAPSFEGGDPTYIVECSSNVRCPEGLPLAGCPAGNYGVACVNCAANHFDDNGLCMSCSDSNFVVWPLIVAIVFGLVGLVIVYKFATRVDRSSRDSVATIIIAAGLILAIFQDLPSFGKVKVKWVEPLKTLRGVLSFLSFDIGVLRPNCWLGPRNPTMSYFYTILSYPCGACTVCAFLAFGKYALRKDVTLNDAININGLLLSAVYMALASVSLRPFKCLGNPDGSASLGADRSILCWQRGDHQLMVALSFLPMLGGVLSYLTLIIWAVTQYPRKVSRPGGVKFVKRWSFAFSRFNPTSYYFILVLVLRDLLIGMTPVILASLNELLFLLWIVTLTSYATLQARLWPWKSQMANILDSGLTGCLIAVVVLGCMLLDFNVARGTVVIQILSITAFVAVVLLVLYRAYKPSKTYGIFLSHHKLGAAVLCRWFKMLLTGIIKDRIFLDSDDVNKLDAIIEVCAWDCENVVVIMTSETLKRMWCAAEIASAHAGEGKVVLVSCDGNGFTDELIEMLPDLWSDEQQATLAAAGISMQAVEEAYNSLSEQKPIPLRRRGAKEQEHFNVAKLVVSQCTGLSPFLLTRLQKTQRQNSGPTGMTSSQLGEIQQSLIMLLGDLDTPESGCSCRVLQALLQGKMHEGVTVVDANRSVRNLPGLEAQYEGSRAILVVLTQGVLHQPSFAAALAMCPEDARSKLVPVKADELFIYPDPEFWEKLGQGLIFSKEMLESLQTDFESVRIIYQQLFNVLALKFTSHGSNHIQAAEIMVLVGRLLPMIEAPSADSTVERASALQRLRTIMSSAESRNGKVGSQRDSSPSEASPSAGPEGRRLTGRVPLELVFDDSDDDDDSSKDLCSTDMGYMKSLEGFEEEFHNLSLEEMEKRTVKEAF